MKRVSWTLLLLALAVCLNAPSIRAQGARSLDDKEKAVVEHMLSWARSRAVSRNQSLDRAQRQAAEIEGEAAGAKANQILIELRPPAGVPSRTEALEIFQYVIGLVEKYRPHEALSFTAEVDFLLAESSKNLLDALKSALEMYQRDKGTYPPSGSVSLSKALAREGVEGYVKLPKTFFDKEGRILDEWGRPLVYTRLAPNQYLLYSVGPNGKDETGTGDDIAVSRR